MLFAAPFPRQNPPFAIPLQAACSPSYIGHAGKSFLLPGSAAGAGPNFRPAEAARGWRTAVGQLQGLPRLVPGAPRHRTQAGRRVQDPVERIHGEQMEWLADCEAVGIPSYC
jgi:hypothetical protein